MVEELILDKNQKKALEIYLDSAVFENDYKPASCEKIEEKLKEQGFTGTKSTINRWINKFNFKSHLEFKVQTSFTKDKSLAKTTEALRLSVQKDLVTVERNAQLIADSYSILEAFSAHVLKEIKVNKRFVRDDIKLAKDIAVLVTGREDKMLDRLALIGSEKISSKELLEEFANVIIEVED
jgi:transposase